jgi:UDP-N-acetylmuramoyl-L-alanyl-D-glutamate--2,6-diaminopimelate ligase
MSDHGLPRKDDHTVKTLADLIQGLDATVWQGDAAGPVRDIAYDSRQAGPGDVFVALPGMTDDGHHHIGDAYRRGARAFVVQHWPADGPPDATVVRVPDTRHGLALMSQRFFDFPDRQLTVVGITGTKGKTTISFMLQAICQAAGRQVGLIGSNGYFFDSIHVKLANTTPESYQLHQILSQMVAAGVQVVVIETTSQGFLMRRTDGMAIDVGVFTNIARDHISALEHPGFADYLACKQHIFTQSAVCVVNRDAELFDQIIQPATCPVVTYGFGAAADYRATDIVTAAADHGLATRFRWRDHDIRLALPGQFNVSNALAAIAVADRLGIGPAQIATGLAQARVAGRMEVVPVPAPYTVMIDFAHNRLSMEALMTAVRAVKPRRVLAVFGLEGDRFRGRRFDCGAVLGRQVDHTILADASPRFDDPDQILADIASGIESSGGAGTYQVIRDRHQAIPAILRQAGPGDVVLLIGKGGVLYEEVRGVNTPIDERQIVRDFFQPLPG